MEPEERLKFSLFLLIVGELPDCDFLVHRNMYVEVMRQVFMLSVIDPEALCAAVIHTYMFEFGSI
jgi:hypothetical protein